MFFFASYGAQIGSVKTTSVINPSLPARREQSHNHSIDVLQCIRNTFYDAFTFLNIARKVFIVVQNTFYSSITSFNVSQKVFICLQNTFYVATTYFNIARTTFNSSQSTFNNRKNYVNGLIDIIIAFKSPFCRVRYFPKSLKHTPDLSLDYPRSTVKLTGYPFPKPDFIFS